MVELGQTQLAYFTEVDHKLVDRARAAVLSRFSATCLADNAVVTSCVVLCAKLLREGSRSSRLTGCRRGAESSKDVAPDQ